MILSNINEYGPEYKHNHCGFLNGDAGIYLSVCLINAVLAFPYTNFNDPLMFVNLWAWIKQLENYVNSFVHTNESLFLTRHPGLFFITRGVHAETRCCVISYFPKNHCMLPSLSAKVNPHLKDNFLCVLPAYIWKIHPSNWAENYPQQSQKLFWHM